MLQEPIEDMDEADLDLDDLDDIAEGDESRPAHSRGNQRKPRPQRRGLESVSEDEAAPNDVADGAR